jgi:hypothetical protein
VIGVTLAVVALAAVVIYLSVSRCQKARAVASGAPAGPVMPGAGVRLGGVPLGSVGGRGIPLGNLPAQNWGPGRPLGRAPLSPASPNDLAAPLDPTHGQV